MSADARKTHRQAIRARPKSRPTARTEGTTSPLDRRLAEGKTKKEVIRCLKRFVDRELYRTLRADLATLTTRT